MKHKIGAFFGCFNPIHNGHLAMAEEILNKTDIDEILFVPSYDCGFKKLGENDIAKFEDRCNMIVEAIIPYHTRIQISNVEFYFNEDNEKPYTYRVLEELSKQYKSSEICLIIGADNFLNIETWKNHYDILAKYQIYIVPRTGYEITETIMDRIGFGIDTYLKVKKNLVSTLHYDFKSEDKSEENVMDIPKERVKNIHILNNIKTIDISSTEIRNKYREGKIINSLLPLSVLKYIKEHNLYKTEKEKRKFITDYLYKLSFEDLKIINELLDERLKEYHENR